MPSIEAPTIQIVKFYEEHSPTTEDPHRMVDMVEYCQPGRRDRSTTRASVSSIMRVQPAGSNANPAVVMANHRADVIGRYYKAWKAGNEMPLDGTPIGAFPALTSEQCEALKAAGIRTIEEIAGLNDATMERVPVSRPRDLKKQAIQFLASKDQVKFVAELSERDKRAAALEAELEHQKDHNKHLADQLAALSATVASLKGDKGGKKSA
jgi:hypothetical protein